MRLPSLTLLALAVLVCSSWVVPASTSAQDAAALEQRISKLEKENAQLQQIVKKLLHEVELLKQSPGQKPVAGKDIPKKPTAGKEPYKKPVAAKANYKKPGTEKEPIKKPAPDKGSFKKPVPDKVIDKKTAPGKETFTKPGTEKGTIKKPVPEKGSIKKPAPVKDTNKKPVPEKEAFKKPGTVKEPPKKPAPAKDASKKPAPKTDDKEELKPESKPSPDKSAESVEIPPGKLVLSVKFDLSPELQEQLRIGDKVDVFSTYTSINPEKEEEKPQSKTKRILSAVEIFALDTIRTADSPEKGPAAINVVSFLVDQDQAGMLMIAEKKGTLSLALLKK